MQATNYFDLIVSPKIGTGGIAIGTSCSSTKNRIGKPTQIDPLRPD